jgi:hypothetical protein
VPAPTSQRYDFLSTGMGAMCVTGYCVAKGQDPGTAATITVAATVGALVRIRGAWGGGADQSWSQINPVLVWI